MIKTVSFPQPRRLGWAALLLLVGCAQVPVGPLPGQDGVTREFLYTPDQSELVSRTPDEAVDVASAATRRSVEEIAQRRQTEEIRLDQLAYFFRSGDGRDYLMSEGPKALVRGHPQQSCPVEVAVTGAPPDPRSRNAIASALMQCHADLAALGRKDSCGCRLMAHENVLHAPPADFEYAVDLPVRLFRDGRLDPVTYFSRAGSVEDGNRAIVVEAGGERLLVISYGDVGARTAVVNFPDGTQAPAERTPVGYDRGRLRESFTTTQPDGARLRVIVGP